MLLKDFSKKLLPGLILSAFLVMGAKAAPDNVNDHKSAVKKSESKTVTKREDTKAKPVHSLFTYVNSLSELQQKLKEAKSEKKPVMVEFFANWCPACRALDQQVLSLASVQQLMRPFVKLRVDLTDKDSSLMQIANHYQVYGTPTFIFFDKNGNEHNVDRFRSIDEFKNVLIRFNK